MKFTLSWLKEYLETDASLEEICERLTALGLEVDSVEDKAADFAPFKVAHVISAEQHPNADRLRVCQVETADHGKVQVVCGAPNARAGMKAVFAPSGSYIPGLDVTLKPSKIRDVESNGMLVSEKEMQLSDEHQGIIDLPEDTPVGTPMATLFGLDDPVIEISLTPDRADCAGIYGIARDLAASGLGKMKFLDVKPAESKFENPISVSIEDKQACPLFLGRYIRGVKNGPSPKWLQQKLKAIGLRPISALVDITNYFSVALCRPLHVFDADKIKGNLSVRLSSGGETLNGLNDKSYMLGEGMTAVCDDSGVIGLGGVLGGVETGCTDDTVNVYIECAYFDPVRTALTGRKLQINSDARYRFERGVDPAFTVPAMELATQMVMDLCGGTPSKIEQAGDVPDNSAEIPFTPANSKKRLGIDIPEKRQLEILENLGFRLASYRAEAEVSLQKVERKDSSIAADKSASAQNDKVYNIVTPSWRVDCDQEADLIEEIIRVYGYDKLESVTLKKSLAVNMPAETHKGWLMRNCRYVLAARGLSECVTWSFMDEKMARHFGVNDNNHDGLTLLNPISEDLKQMRPSILPNLLQAAQKNSDRGYPNAALFEIGPVFYGQSPDEQPLCAAGVRLQNTIEKGWDTVQKPADLYDVKADAFAVIEALGLKADNLQLSRDVPSWYHPGRAGAIQMGKVVLGYFGELHPLTLEQLDIDSPAAAFELFPENLPQRKYKGAAKPLLALNPLMPLSRDFAFIVDHNVAANDVIQSARAADKKLITRVHLFDVYQGKGVEEGKKSLAITVQIQPQGQSLTEQEIEALSAKIIENVSKKTGGILRG